MLDSYQRIASAMLQLPRGLNVDAAIDEIMSTDPSKPMSDEDIPL